MGIHVSADGISTRMSKDTMTAHSRASLTIFANPSGVNCLANVVESLARFSSRSYALKRLTVSAAPGIQSKQPADS